MTDEMDEWYEATMEQRAGGYAEDYIEACRRGATNISKGEFMDAAAITAFGQNVVLPIVMFGFYAAILYFITKK